MDFHFTKYHGTGNDFILIDDRDSSFNIDDVQLIRSMCSRRFGIGADGLILLRNIKGFDFEMVYFNSDGNQSSMCGNGGRCIVHFANSLNVFKEKCVFLAIDGPHEANVIDIDNIKLKMADVEKISKDQNAYILDTGSPHFVETVEEIKVIDVKTSGSKIRYSPQYTEKGINVNFLQLNNNGIQVATYERGVEDETYSCGTGVTACALVANIMNESKYSSPISIETKGGSLAVYFEKYEYDGYYDIWLEGPAVITFKGTYQKQENN